LMVAAIRGEDGKWEPIGLPNIQKKDVELLERMNGTPTQTFEPSPQVAFELTEAELRSISMDKLLYCVPPRKEKSIAVQSTVTVESELSI
jgi:hypothetical protein